MEVFDTGIINGRIEIILKTELKLHNQFLIRNYMYSCESKDTSGRTMYLVYIHLPIKHYKKVNLFVDFVEAYEMTMKHERAKIKEMLSNL